MQLMILVMLMLMDLVISFIVYWDGIICVYVADDGYTFTLVCKGTSRSTNDRCKGTSNGSGAYRSGRTTTFVMFMLW